MTPIITVKILNIEHTHYPSLTSKWKLWLCKKLNITPETIFSAKITTTRGGHPILKYADIVLICGEQFCLTDVQDSYTFTQLERTNNKLHIEGTTTVILISSACGENSRR
jgi:hypothetical protein